MISFIKVKKNVLHSALKTNVKPLEIVQIIKHEITCTTKIYKTKLYCINFLLYYTGCTQKAPPPLPKAAAIRCTNFFKLWDTFVVDLPST